MWRASDEGGLYYKQAAWRSLKTDFPRRYGELSCGLRLFWQSGSGAKVYGLAKGRCMMQSDSTPRALSLSEKEYVESFRVSSACTHRVGAGEASHPCTGFSSAKLRASRCR